MDGDGPVARLALHPLQLVDHVYDRAGGGRAGVLRPLDEVELRHHAALLGLKGQTAREGGRRETERAGE